MLLRITRAVAGIAMTFVMVTPTSSRAEPRAVPPALDERSFLRRVHERAPQRVALEARARAAAAAVAAAGVRPNPWLGYEREAVPSIASSNDFVRLGWTLDLSGRRSRGIDAAQARADAERASVARELFVLELDARAAYLAATYARMRVARLELARAELAAIVETLRARAAQGDASDYDAERVALELDLVDDQLADATRVLELARLALGAWLGEPRVAYDAADALVLPRANEVAVIGRRDDVDAARARARQADREAALARRTWIPRLDLVGGLLASTSNSGSGIGYVVGISGDLPVFDRGGAAAARSTAERTRWLREADALGNDARAEVERTRRALALRIAQAERYAAGPAKRAVDLERRAVVTYREGDRPLLELLDVQRTARQTGLRALELIYEARRAELALERAIGRKP